MKTKKHDAPLEMLAKRLTIETGAASIAECLSKPLASSSTSGEIVVPAGRILLVVLKQAAGESDLVLGFDGKRGCRGPTKVVRAHCGAEVMARAPADDQVNCAGRKPSATQ